jgi:hypothetical protein
MNDRFTKSISIEDDFICVLVAMMMMTDGWMCVMCVMGLMGDVRDVMCAILILHCL